MMQHEPIPGFVSAGAILAGLADVMMPPQRLTIAECAAKYRVLHNPGGGYSGPWLNERAPWLVRPMNCLGDPAYSRVAVQGPGQSGKSEVPNNWLAQTYIDDPANMIWCGPDKNLMGAYVREKIDTMIANSPALKAKQLTTTSADNIYLKIFQGGQVNFIWPVPANFRMRSAPRFVFDDYDDIPQEIGGQGSPLQLMGTRQTTFEGSDKGYIASSPALGIDKGIEAIVAGGTDERWTWDCLHCGDPFVPEFEAHCQFDRSGDPEVAAETVVLVCPHCGAVMEHRDKAALNRTGRWIGRGQTALPGGLVEGDLYASATASFRLDGVATFASWPRLARRYREAEITFETTQDEGPLRAVVNTAIGKNYVSRVELPQVDAADLKERSGGYEMGTVPSGYVCLTAAVDVQGQRFAVLVQAWKNGLESAIVDRFDILTLPDGRTAIDPAGHAEHWSEILRRVIWSRYPCSENPDSTLPILNTAIDTGGAEGVSDNATTFWRKARAAGVDDKQITLIKGASTPKAALWPAPTWLERDDFGRAIKSGPKLYVPNVHQLKNIVDVRLRRRRPGPGYIALPRGFSDDYLDEMTAEAKDDDGKWHKLRRRNESWDLLVYNAAALLRHAKTRDSLSWVPEWARPSHPGETTPPAGEPQKRANAVRRRRRSRGQVRV